MQRLVVSGGSVSLVGKRLMSACHGFGTTSPQTTSGPAVGEAQEVSFDDSDGHADSGSPLGLLSVVGDTFVDIICGTLDTLPAWGADAVVTDPIRLMLGGSAANFAVHSSTLIREGLLSDTGSNSEKGFRSCLLHTSVGGDSLGSFVKAELGKAGVSWSQQQEEGNQGACVVLSGRKDRSFVTYRGSVADFCSRDLDVGQLMSSSHVHVAGYFNCPGLWGDLPELLEKVRARGATCSLGPQYDATEAWTGLDNIYPLLDVFLPNQVVDTTGAGDAFSAGFTHVWKATGGGDVQAALAWGCALGTTLVTRAGASEMVTLEEIKANLILERDISST